MQLYGKSWYVPSENVTFERQIREELANKESCLIKQKIASIVYQCKYEVATDCQSQFFVDPIHCAYKSARFVCFGNHLRTHWGETMDSLSRKISNMEPFSNETPTDECDLDLTLFFGHCFTCNNPGSQMQPLKRCGGCQLVGYCSKIFQKYHWILHKYVCKEFPVVNGKNVLHTTGSWEEHIANLRKRAAQLPEAKYIEKRDESVLMAANAKRLLSNPRVCNICHESNPNRLTDCKCASVTYCSKKCADTDNPHKDACKLLEQIAHAYTDRFNGDDNTMADELEMCVMTVWSALNFVSKLKLSFGIGRKQLSVDEVTTLNIHVITSKPMFYHKTWDRFLHRFPKLKELNLVFVMHANALKSSVNFNYSLRYLSKLRCEDCEANDREITYFVEQHLYHMFFSSKRYTEPDVVMVYGNTSEMSVRDEDDINSKISYCNMIHSKHTILILTDETEDMLQLATWHQSCKQGTSC